VTIVFDDDETETVGFLVHKPKTVLASQTLAEQLGLELTPSGDLKVAQPIPLTSVPGVYAAGDCSTFMKMVTNALASGIAVAAGVSMQLQMEA
jgi:thioredoxin reductase